MSEGLQAFLHGRGPSTADGMPRASTEFLIDRCKMHFAWNELKRRLRERLESGRPIEGPLATWAAKVAVGELQPPRLNQKEDRDMRIAVVVDVLRDHDCTERQAVALVAEALSRSPEAVYSALRKVRNSQPFVCEKLG